MGLELAVSFLRCKEAAAISQLNLEHHNHALVVSKISTHGREAERNQDIRDKAQAYRKYVEEQEAIDKELADRSEVSYRIYRTGLFDRFGRPLARVRLFAKEARGLPRLPRLPEPHCI